jgi:hypothetical protein
MSEFKVVKYTDFGTSEPWVARIVMGPAAARERGARVRAAP